MKILTKVRVVTPLLAALALLLFIPWQCQANGPKRHLVLIGGGDLPEQAVAKFSEWAGGTKARVVMICWATETPENSLAYLTGRLNPYQPAKVERLASMDNAFDPAVALAQIDQATAIYFSGGDQVLAMQGVNKYPAIKEALLKKYQDGVVFGGTSAGTALMSKTMLTGNGDFTVIDSAKVETSEGLGLVSSAIVDQHFLRRQRLNRLISVLLGSQEKVALGIDEDGAVLLEDEVHGTVAGQEKIIRLEKNSKGEVVMAILGQNAQFTL